MADLLKSKYLVRSERFGKESFVFKDARAAAAYTEQGVASILFVIDDMRFELRLTDGELRAMIENLGSPQQEEGGP